MQGAMRPCHTLVNAYNGVGQKCGLRSEMIAKHLEGWVLTESKSPQPDGVEPEWVDNRSEWRRPQLRTMAAAGAQNEAGGGGKHNGSVDGVSARS